MKASDIDYIALVRGVAEAIMDGGEGSPPSAADLVRTVTPNLLTGDINRAGGPVAIIDWALDQMERKGIVGRENGHVTLRRSEFAFEGSRIIVLPQETREKLTKLSFLRHRTAQEWQKARKKGQLPYRSKTNEIVLRSIREHGFKEHFGLIVVDEHGDVIVGRNRMWALRSLGVEPVRDVHYRVRKYGEGELADNERLRDAILDNAGDALSNQTIAALAKAILPDGDGVTLSDLLDFLVGSSVTKELQKEVALGLKGRMSQRKIAQAVGVPRRTVDGWLQGGQESPTEQNLSEEPRRKRGSVSMARRPEIRDEYRRLKTAGLSNEMICEQMGIAEGTRHGISVAVALEDEGGHVCPKCGHVF